MGSMGLNNLEGYVTYQSAVARNPVSASYVKENGAALKAPGYYPDALSIDALPNAVFYAPG